MAVKYIRLQNGYVEDNTVSILEWYHDKGFPTRYEALADLCKHIFQDFHKVLSREPSRACCKRAAEAKANFCSACGRKVNSDAWVSSYQDHLSNLHYSSTVDMPISYGAMESAGWDFYGSPFGIAKEEALCIGQYGSEVLFLASTDAIPEGEMRDQWETFVTDGDAELPYWAGGSLPKIMSTLKEKVNDESF